MSENPYNDRRAIDRAVDGRRRFNPRDVSPVHVRMTPAEMLRAVGYPAHTGPHEHPTHCTYRGYRIEART